MREYFCAFGLYILFFPKFIEKAKSLAKKCGKIFIPYAKMRGCGDKLVTWIYRRILTFYCSWEGEDLLTFSVSVTKSTVPYYAPSGWVTPIIC